MMLETSPWGQPTPEFCRSWFCTLWPSPLHCPLNPSDESHWGSSGLLSMRCTFSLLAQLFCLLPYSHCLLRWVTDSVYKYGHGKLVSCLVQTCSPLSKADMPKALVTSLSSLPLTPLLRERREDVVSFYSQPWADGEVCRDPDLMPGFYSSHW